MTERRHIRIVLTPDDAIAFQSVKQEVEQAMGITMSDSVFALGMIRKAVRDRFE